MARVNGILFDLGDTILDFGPIDTAGLFVRGARLAYRRLQQLGQPVPSFRTYHRRQLRAVRFHYILSRIRRREFSSRNVLGRECRRMGRQITPEVLMEVAWLYYWPLGRCATVEDGVPELLGDFRDQGIKLAIVSNTFVPGEVLDKHLEMLGLREFFPLRIYSCDVHYRKPDGRIFRIALERAGLEASQTLFVGDSLVADIRGSRSAGMTAVLKDPTGAKRKWRAHPHHRITALRELRGIVAGRNGGAA